MAYVDGFVIAVPTRKMDEYRRTARVAGKIWMEHGALEYIECVGEDLDTEKMGTPFPRRVGAKKGESVVFSWVRYRSRADRDRVNQAVMADPRMKKMMRMKMPFATSAMSYGGFDVMLAMGGERARLETSERRAARRAFR